MKILVLDNYDSFTYNLVQYIQDILGQKINVVRNDAIDLDAVAAYDVIILSPGPGVPSEAGIMPELIKRYAPEKPILGVCLGHQAIGEAFGARLENLTQVYHGIETPIKVTDEKDPLFRNIPDVFHAGRYHSWIVRKDSLPSELKITAIDVKGEIMAMRHTTYPVFGVQFHPESVMTSEGKKMLANFLSSCGVEIPREALMAE
ncbi:MAG TPA: aminodeoxychorismate/anthranilate synthase component II [Saprospiraceae bacterium]|nr:aminodeoxychorismate/anthranilate synthase component II [Saprospiraceae bacterium]